METEIGSLFFLCRQTINGNQRLLYWPENEVKTEQTPVLDPAELGFRIQVFRPWPPFKVTLKLLGP
jgi:hypothetical protein